MHVSSRLVSSVALLYSISSDKFDVIFLRSIRKNVFNIKHLIYAYIIFSGQLFSTHANLFHCATCSEAKVCSTSAFQLILVPEIKK